MTLLFRIFSLNHHSFITTLPPKSLDSMNFYENRTVKTGKEIKEHTLIPLYKINRDPRANLNGLLKR